MRSKGGGGIRNEVGELYAMQEQLYDTTLIHRNQIETLFPLIS